MSDNLPTPDPAPATSPADVPHEHAVPCEDATQTTEGRPPFNELSVLFPLLTIYTTGYLGLMLADFLLKKALDLPDGIMPIYIALLGAYTADKEIRRWVVTPEPPRKGSIFVYLWMLFFLGAYIIRSFQPDYELPANLATICLQVLGIFFGSKASKFIWENRPGRGEADPGRERLVLDLLAARGQVTRRDVMEKLSVSDNIANRRAGQGQLLRASLISNRPFTAHIRRGVSP